MDFVIVICHTKITKLFSSGRGLIKRVWPRQAARGADAEARNGRRLKGAKYTNKQGE